MNVAFIFYSDLELLLDELSPCHKNPGKSSTIKINKHTTSGYSLFTYCSINATNNKLDCYRSKDCMDRFYKNLKDNATKIINNKKAEMIPLTDEEIKCHKKQKVCYICKKN